MIVYYRESRTSWGKEYYINKWCCDEFRRNAKDYNIEINNKMIQFISYEDEGIVSLPFEFRYCPYCGEKIKIRRGDNDSLRSSRYR